MTIKTWQERLKCGENLLEYSAMQAEIDELRAEVANKATLFREWRASATFAVDNLKTENAALQKRLDAWETLIGKEMPADFKDWHENNKNEWPEIAADMLRRRLARAEESEKRLAAWENQEPVAYCGHTDGRVHIYQAKEIADALGNFEPLYKKPKERT